MVFRYGRQYNCMEFFQDTTACFHPIPMNKDVKYKNRTNYKYITANAYQPCPEE
jgi:hypothetical protein